MRRIHLRDVPDELYKAIRHAAVDAGATINATVIQVLSAHLLQVPVLPTSTALPALPVSDSDDSTTDTRKG